MNINKLEIEENKRLKSLEDMLADDSVKWCYIMKRGSYYRPKSCGYTYREEEAGVYLKADAVQSARSCRDLTLVPTTHEAHRESIEKRIKMTQETAEKEIQILKANCY